MWSTELKHSSLHTGSKLIKLTVSQPSQRANMSKHTFSLKANLARITV